MKKITLIVLLSTLSTGIRADEYHTFSDKSGRVIKAKIIKVDLRSNTVTLKPENKATISVSTDIFSDEDQAYIRQWQPTASTQPQTSTNEKRVLTATEVKEIAKKYVSDKKNEDWKISKDSRLYPYPYEKYRIKSTDLGKVYDNGFELEISIALFPLESNADYSGGQTERTGLVLLTPDGDVKYDSFLNPHPLETICPYINSISGDYLHKRPYSINEFITTMKKGGVPTFGLTSNSNREEFGKEALKIIEWLIDNGETHDVTEPKVYVPSKVFDKLKDSLKSSKKNF